MSYILKCEDVILYNDSKNNNNIRRNRRIVLSGVNAYSADSNTLKNIFNDWSDIEIESLRIGGASMEWWKMIGKDKGIDFEPLEKNWF